MSDNYLLRLKNIYWNYYNKYYLPFKKIKESNSSISNTILVVGSARSGTTWLGDVCAQLLDARPIFEPFILDRNRKFYFSNSIFKRFWNDKIRRKLLMNYSLYFTDNSELPPSLFRQISNILRGYVRSQWTDRGISFDKNYNYRVIKEVRANLMLKFLAQRWPELKIIWIIRNPLNVVQSQLYLSVRYNWGFDLDYRMFEQEELLRDWLFPLLDKIKKAKSLPERLMHRWCIENYIPFKQKIYQFSNVQIVFYDKLLSSESEWENILSFLNIDASNKKLLMKYISRPSLTSRRRTKEELNFTLQKVGYSEEKLKKIIDIYELSDLVLQNL